MIQKCGRQENGGATDLRPWKTTRRQNRPRTRHTIMSAGVCMCVPPKRNPKRKLRRSPGDESVSTLMSDVHASGAHRP